jgi:hypothetical protein
LTDQMEETLQNEAIDSLVSIEVDMSGCVYTGEMSESLAEELSSFAPTTCVGHKAPAAGPALLLEVVLRFIAEAAAEWAVGKVLDQIAESLSKHRCNEPTLGKVEIQTDAYSIVILDTSFIYDAVQKATSSTDDCLQMIPVIRKYVHSESRNGRRVGRITLPCSIEETLSEKRCIVGCGRSDLWLVEYNDCERLPIVYDSATESTVTGITDWLGRR